MPTFKKCFLSIVTVILALGTMTTSAFALIINGGFETGDFTGWAITTGGGNPQYGISDHNIVPSVFVNGGNYQASLSTGPSGSFTPSSVAMTQIISANSGDFISFDYNFSTLEIPLQNPIFQSIEDSFNDTALFRITNMNFPANSYAISIADAKYLNKQGNQNFQYAISDNGVYELSISIFDVGDQERNSQISIDNIQQITTVPEPSTLIFLVAGFVGLAAYGRKMFNK